MGVRIMESHGREYAVLYDSVTMTAFGPVITRGTLGESAEQMAEKFLAFCERVDGKDVRAVSAETLCARYDRWYKRNHIDDGWDDETGTTALQRMSLERGR